VCPELVVVGGLPSSGNSNVVIDAATNIARSRGTENRIHHGGSKDRKGSRTVMRPEVALLASILPGAAS
jgi:hypothetical protein